MNTEIGLWLLVFSFIAALIGIWWLFDSNRSKPPTLLERTVATGWLVVRRLVCFAGALLFLVGAVAVAFNLGTSATPIDTFTRLGYALFMLFISALCIWAAIYGWGNSRGDWKEGTLIHRKNKKRYGWRW